MVSDFRYIIKRIIIGVGIILVMTFIRSCNVKAATYNMPYQDITINNSNWFSTYGYYGTTFATSGTSINFDIYANESSYDFAISQATAVVMDVCVSTGFSQITRTADFGASCPNSCFTQNPYYVDLKASCKYNNSSNTGFLFRVFVPVLKWNYGSGCGQTGCHPTLNDSITFKANAYNGNITFLNLYLTDEVIGTNYNQNFDIINNQIIQAQNQAHSDAQQAHTDAQNTQSAINDVNSSLNDSSIPSDSTSKINNITNAITANQNSSVVQIATFFPQVLQLIVNGMNTSCTGGYSLGSLYGTELTIPCINPVDYLGNTIWGTIDAILCLCYLIPLCKFLVNKYNDLTSMNNLRWQ